MSDPPYVPFVPLCFLPRQGRLARSWSLVLRERGARGRYIVVCCWGAGQGRAGQGRAGPGRAGQGRAGPGLTSQATLALATLRAALRCSALRCGPAPSTLRRK